MPKGNEKVIVMFTFSSELGCDRINNDLFFGRKWTYTKVGFVELLAHAIHSIYIFAERGICNQKVQNFIGQKKELKICMQFCISVNF